MAADWLGRRANLHRGGHGGVIGIGQSGAGVEADGEVMADVASQLAQHLWRHLEPIHALVYFAPEHRAACDAIGLRGGWMAYFASRAAPLGAASPGLVTALFYNFHPRLVARSLPDAWAFAAPDAVLEARLSAIDRALRRELGSWLMSPELEQAAEQAHLAASDLPSAGRPMYAANLTLPWPNEPHLVLWHAATLLREHRGDGHNAALLTHDIDGCEAHVLQVADRVVPRSVLQPYRGFSDDEWTAATARLRQRGLLDEQAELTAAGRALRADIASRTDQLAAGPVDVLGVESTEVLLTALAPIRSQLAEGAIPFPNRMGVPPTDDDWRELVAAARDRTGDGSDGPSSELL